jgi:hypothetical protein
MLLVIVHKTQVQPSFLECKTRTYEDLDIMFKRVSKLATYKNYVVDPYTEQESDRLKLPCKRLPSGLSTPGAPHLQNVKTNEGN